MSEKRNQNDRKVKDSRGNILMVSKPYGIKELVDGVLEIHPPVIVAGGKRHYYLTAEKRVIDAD